LRTLAGTSDSGFAAACQNRDPKIRQTEGRDRHLDDSKFLQHTDRRSSPGQPQCFTSSILKPPRGPALDRAPPQAIRSGSGAARPGSDSGPRRHGAAAWRAAPAPLPPSSPAGGRWWCPIGQGPRCAAAARHIGCQGRRRSPILPPRGRNPPA
jgi:hypothetical protein